jgi:hypothetical protein
MGQTLRRLLCPSVVTLICAIVGADAQIATRDFGVATGAVAVRDLSCGRLLASDPDNAALMTTYYGLVRTPSDKGLRSAELDSRVVQYCRAHARSTLTHAIRFVSEHN